MEHKTQKGYRVSIEPCPDRVQVIYKGCVLADSNGTLIMRETRLPPVYYFPREDVRERLLVRTDHKTYCPFKGNASYWSISVNSAIADNAVWSYEEPFDEASVLRNYLAFDWDSVEAWIVNEKALTVRPEAEVVSEANPFVEWLVDDAWKANSSPDLLKSLADTLNQNGFQLSRLVLLLRTMNPQLFASSYTWQRTSDQVTEFQASHAGLQTEAYRNSPFYPIINGEGGVRRRLEGPNPKLDFPVLAELLEEGATDYVAFPLKFSDGQINILTMTSDRPGGFSIGELGQLYEILPNLSRILEVHARQVSSLTLLQTYLGRNAGRKVMDGLIKRGDSERLHAVIYFTDLRGSTELSKTLKREKYLECLDQFFDSVAGAVIDNGGEVLKFIGDAVLAIFVIDPPDEPKPEACRHALAAAREALSRLAVVNAARRKNGDAVLNSGTGLHRGGLTYGNIGTVKRLDFTVIGPAVNEASRIEDLSKELGYPILLSQAFAASVSEPLISLGMFKLRGVVQENEIFTLADLVNNDEQEVKS